MSQLLSIGSIIDHTFDEYRHRFVEFISVSAWLLVIAILQSIALLFYPSVTQIASNTSFTGLEAFGVILYAFSAIILAPLVGLWLFVSLVRLIRMQQAKLKRSNVSKALKEGWTFFGPNLLVTALVALVLFGGLLASFAPAILTGIAALFVKVDALYVATTIFVVLGLFAALIVNFRFTIHYIFAPYAVCYDNVRGANSLKESRSLVQGRFWSVFLRIVIPKLLFLTVAALVMWLVSSLASVLISALAGLNLDFYLRVESLADVNIPLIIAVFVNPLMVIADMIIYRNLKELR